MESAQFFDEMAMMLDPSYVDRNQPDSILDVYDVLIRLSLAAHGDGDKPGIDDYLKAGSKDQTKQQAQEASLSFNYAKAVTMINDARGGSKKAADAMIVRHHTINDHAYTPFRVMMAFIVYHKMKKKGISDYKYKKSVEGVIKTIRNYDASDKALFKALLVEDVHFGQKKEEVANCGGREGTVSIHLPTYVGTININWTTGKAADAIARRVQDKKE